MQLKEFWRLFKLNLKIISEVIRINSKEEKSKNKRRRKDSNINKNYSMQKLIKIIILTRQQGGDDRTNTIQELRETIEVNFW